MRAAKQIVFRYNGDSNFAALVFSECQSGIPWAVPLCDKSSRIDGDMPTPAS
jgi:hypothetical protein